MHSVDSDFTLHGKVYMYIVRMHWAKIKNQDNETSKQNYELQKKTQSMFVHCQNKNEIFKQFYRN